MQYAGFWIVCMLAVNNWNCTYSIWNTFIRFVCTNDKCIVRLYLWIQLSFSCNHTMASFSYLNMCGRSLFKFPLRKFLPFSLFAYILLACEAHCYSICVIGLSHGLDMTWLVKCEHKRRNVITTIEMGTTLGGSVGKEGVINQSALFKISCIMCTLGARCIAELIQVFFMK